MNFGFFEQMSGPEAETYLADLRRLGAEGVASLAEMMGGEVIELDYSLDSVRPFAELVARRAVKVPRSPDESLPGWLRESLREGDAYDFDDPSKILVLRFSYYLGEAFVRTWPNGLRWTVGEAGTAEENQPVVAGFMHRLELAPLLVGENLLRDLIEAPDRPERVDSVVQGWRECLPPGA